MKFMCSSPPNSPAETEPVRHSAESAVSRSPTFRTSLTATSGHRAVTSTSAVAFGGIDLPVSSSVLEQSLDGSESSVHHLEKLSGFESLPESPGLVCCWLPFAVNRSSIACWETNTT